MDRIFAALVALAFVCSCSSGTPYSTRMVESEISRNPHASFLDGREGKLKWNYTTGLELLSFLDAAEAAGLDDVTGYVKEWADSMLLADGGIRTYSLEKYNVDHICPARIYLRLYDRYGDARYRQAADLVRSQIDSHPRTVSGAFWHKKIYPDQIWLDGLYMAMPFYAEYTARFAVEQERDSLFSDIAHEFEVARDKTFDPVTGLFRHACDESRSMFWADPLTGQSAHAWGRAVGWYAMALVDVLDSFPQEHPGRDSLVSQLGYLLNAVMPYADPQTGMWYQVLDCPGREGNYLEATCSAMFTYAALKSVRMGYLDSKDWGERSRRLYTQFVDRFVRENPDGTISITDCCAVGGLGGDKNRAGDFAYYLSEPVIENDCKGVGPFIWASLEYENLK